MVGRELENGGPDGPISLENLLQRRRAESRIDGRVQGEIKKSLVEFLDRGQMHKVKHRQRGSKKMQSAADDGLGRSLHVNVGSSWRRKWRSFRDLRDPAGGVGHAGAEAPKAQVGRLQLGRSGRGTRRRERGTCRRRVGRAGRR